MPGAGRHRFWAIEDLPSPRAPEPEQLAGYRRVRDALRAHIDQELLLPALRRALPLRK